MGKKKKNRAKKIFREQAQALETAQTQTEQAQATDEQEEAKPQDEAEVSAVKKEIKKILITIAILGIIIVAFAIVNIKTDFILKLGAWISRVLNINV